MELCARGDVRNVLESNQWTVTVNSVPKDLRERWRKVNEIAYAWLTETHLRPNLAYGATHDEEDPEWEAEWEAAVWMVMALSALLLRKRKGKQCTDWRNRFPIRRRLDAFIEGDWEGLWKETVDFTEQDKEARGRRSDITAKTGAAPGVRDAERCHREAMLKLRLGEFSGAVDALRPAPSAPGTAETLASLRELHPKPTGEEFWGEFWKRRLRDLIAEAPAGDLFGVEDYARALKSAMAGKAADRWGCRYEHLKVLAGRADKRPACFLGMHRLAMAVLSGDIPESLVDCIGGARLAALSKPGAEGTGRAAIRPIGVIDIVRRLIARAAMKVTGDAVGDFLSDGDKRVWQLACNISRGVHKAFVGVIETLRNHPEWLAVTGDVRNAFKSISLESWLKLSTRSRM